MLVALRHTIKHGDSPAPKRDTVDFCKISNCNDGSLVRIAVLESMGIGYFMESNVREDIEAGRLVQLLEEWTPPLSPLCLYYPSRRNPPAAVKVFVDLARELARSSRSRR